MTPNERWELLKAELRWPRISQRDGDNVGGKVNTGEARQTCDAAVGTAAGSESR
jgi:hypothetical protein